jgi:hypothetical protein
VSRHRAAQRQASGLGESEVAELARLRRAELRMERVVLKRSVVLWVTGDEVTVVDFIADRRTCHGVPHQVTCRALDVSPSWLFYKCHDRRRWCGSCARRPCASG